jgi:hypothetical protein
MKEKCLAKNNVSIIVINIKVIPILDLRKPYRETY